MNNYYLIEDFKNQEDFETYTHPTTFEDRKKKFKWIKIDKTTYADRKPMFAIKGKLFFENYKIVNNKDFSRGIKNE